MGLSQRKEKLIGRLRNRRMRPREGLFLAEGVRVAGEVLDSDLEVRFAVAAEGLRSDGPGMGVVDRLHEAGVEVAWVGDDELATLADTESPRGLLLVCPEPSWTLDRLGERPGGGGTGRYLLLDGVQDPGNLGTLVRAARAFALDGVVALDGTVDPWNPKAVRAAAGASVRIPVLKEEWSVVDPWRREREIGLLVAEAGGTDVAGVRPTGPWALAVGNEGSGVRDGVLRAARRRVSVPMPGGTESLNVGVAGAILLYELARERSP